MMSRIFVLLALIMVAQSLPAPNTKETEETTNDGASDGSDGDDIYRRY